MVRLVEHTAVGSQPMKVFLQPRVATEFKAGSPDSPRSTASGEGSSSPEDHSEWQWNSEGPAVFSPEDYSEWQWNQSAMCAQNYGFCGTGQYADPQIADFEPFIEPQFGGTAPAAFTPCQPPQSISIKEMYYHQQAMHSVADVCPEMLFSLPAVGGVGSDMSGEALDFQGGTYSEFPSVEPAVVDLGSEMPLSVPLGSVAPDLSCDALELPSVGSDFCSLYSELPSVGSAAHFQGWCKPCAFAYEGCVNGKACEFCHVCPPGELKARKRAKLAQRRKMNRSIAQQNPRWTGR